MTRAAPSLLLEKVRPGATVQDLGRPGRMHDGVPPGGALVPELLVAANRALGNADGAAAIELPLFGVTLRANDAMSVSIDGELRVLAAGESLELAAPARAVRYVAVPGGVDVPLELGGRGTLLVAGLGGLEGRMLRPGDVLRASRIGPARRLACAPTDDDGSPIRVVPGPDAFDEADLATLFGAEFRVSTLGDRVGTRLDGARLTARVADRRISLPMVRGAIQVTADGTPIVLGPDHPTTGGYPVIACVVTRDQGRLASRRPGAPVRFALARGG